MSEVRICNLALSHLGDTAQVTSIKPPDGSVQAQLCANFYWVARNTLLEMAEWGFATRRVALALASTNPTVFTWTDSDGNLNTGLGMWQFAYAMPSGVINALAVISPAAPDDYQANLGPFEAGICDGPSDYGASYPEGYLPVPGAPLNMPQPYAIETDASGNKIILTNVCNAILRYTTLVEDTTKFSPLFTMSLSYLLASMLAGPIIKGDAGMQAATTMLELFESFRGKASANDANQRKTHIQPATSWIKGR